MFKIKGLFSILVFLAVILYVVFFAVQPAKKTQFDSLRIADKYLDFGEVWEQEALKLTLPVTNTSARQIRIAGFRTSCSCTSIEPQELTIEAQSTHSLALTLNLTRSEPLTELAVKDFAVHIRPIILDEPAALTFYWQIHGRIKYGIITHPSSLDFGEIVEGRPLSIPRLLVKYDKHINRIEKLYESPGCPVQITKQINGDNECSFELSLSKNLPKGFFSSRVDLGAFSESGSQLSTLRLPISGTIVERVHLIPDTISCGAVRIGEESQATVVLQSRFDMPFEVEEIEIPNSKSTRIQAVGERSGGNRFTYHVTTTPVSFGAHTEIVRFHIRYGKDNTIAIIPLKVNYYGLANT